MNLKEIVDSYLIDNYTAIAKEQSSGIFSWKNIAQDIAQEKNIDVPDKEYVRDRYRKIKQKYNDIVINSIAKSNITQAEVLNKNIPKEKIDNLNTTINTKFKYLTGKESKEKGTKEWTFTASNIPTEQEIIEYFNIDTTKWKIVNIYHKTSFGGKYSITVQTNLLKGIESENYTEKFDKFIEKYNKTILTNKLNNYSYPKGSENQEKILYLVSLSDLHIGNYQKSDYIESIKDKIFHTLNHSEQLKVDKIILLNTGDLLHTNGSNEKTQQGTQLDSQEPFEDAFTQGLDLITSIIDYASTLSLSVTYVNVRGNHSFDTEYCLGEALKKVYQKQENVEILNQRDTRIYYYWNNNAFLFTHGDKAVERLPLLFATEGREYFQKADNHHIILGHLHHNKGKQFINDRAEYAGIEVRVVGSPTSNDIWHKQNGFCQNKKAVIGMVFTPNQGKYAEFNFKM